MSKFNFFQIVSFLLIFSQNLFAKTNKYRAVIEHNPATEIIIGWNQLTGADAILYLHTSNGEKNILTNGKQFTVNRSNDHYEMRNRFVHLKNLQPNTTYYFVLKDENSVSRVLWFKTLSDKNDPVYIISGGDSRRSDKIVATNDVRFKTNVAVRKLKADFVMFGGDYTCKNIPGQWFWWLEDWQQTIGEDGRLTPIIATRGNHEKNTEVFKIFGLTHEDIVYKTVIGENLIGIYTLNTLNPVSEESNQTKWFASDLKNNQNYVYKLAQYHYPIYPHNESKKPNRGNMYQHWGALFYKHGFDICFESDTHVVKSTWPIVPDASGEKGYKRDDEKGTVFLGEGTWGTVRTNIKAFEWTRAVGAFPQFKWLKVTPEKITVRTVKTENSEKIIAQENFHDRFAMPKGIELWSPKNGTGEEIVIFPKK